RSAHVYIYQFISRWLTPLFQSERDFVAMLRDFAFGPLGRMPVARGEMLKVLAGIKRGWFGSLPLRRDADAAALARPQRSGGGETAGLVQAGPNQDLSLPAPGKFRAFGSSGQQPGRP